MHADRSHADRSPDVLIVGGGIMTQFILSTIAGGFGLYYGVKWGKRYV